MAKSRNYYLVCLLIGTLAVNSKAQINLTHEPIRFLALGDSYTIGESVAEVQRWPVQLVAELKKQGATCERLEIIAITGWRTDDLKNAIRARHPSKDYNLVSLLIGVNNQYQGRSLSDYQHEFEDLLNIAIEHAGGDKSRVFVVSIPDYGYTPFGKEKQREISSQIDAFNEVNKNVAAKSGVAYVDITDISRLGLQDPELVADDGLHPSEKMYSLWVERVLKHLD